MFTRVGALTHPDLAPTIPLILFALFQLKFAIITPALITGSFAERVRFSSYLLFMCLFSIFIYSPLAHWTWHPDGFLHKLGVLDFAGGTVVHMIGRLRRAGRRDGRSAAGTTHMSGEAHDAGEHPVRDPRHRHAVVRLVRLQRGLGALGVGPGGDGVRDDEHGVGVGGAGLDLLRRHARPASRRRSARASAPVVGLVAITPGGRLRAASARASSSAPCASVVSNLMVHWKNAVDARRHARRLPVPRCRRHGRHADDRLFAEGRRPDVGPRTIVPRALRRARVRRRRSRSRGSWMLYKFTDLIIPLRVSTEQEEIGLDLSQHGEVMQDMASLSPRRGAAELANDCVVSDRMRSWTGAQMRSGVVGYASSST